MKKPHQAKVKSLKAQFIVDRVSLPIAKRPKPHTQIRNPPNSYPKWWLKQLRDAKCLLSQGQVGVLQHFGERRGEHVYLFRMRIQLGQEIARLERLTNRQAR